MLREIVENDQAAATGRVVALDRARTFITLLVIVHHSVVNYTYFGNGDRMRWLGFDLVVLFNDSFFMACMFFISGSLGLWHLSPALHFSDLAAVYRLRASVAGICQIRVSVHRHAFDELGAHSDVAENSCCCPDDLALGTNLTGASCSRWRRRVRACDLDDAPRPRTNGESEAVQFYNCRDQVQAKTQARRVFYLVRPVETP